MSVFKTSTLTPNTYFYLYDHNGNVEKVIQPNGAVVAEYQYDGFGNTVFESIHPLARQSLGDGGFRFSTKYWDEEIGLAYYGFRYYSPQLGRWIKRDPIGIEGGRNLHLICKNNAVDYFDYLGNRRISRNKIIVHPTVSNPDAEIGFWSTVTFRRFEPYDVIFVIHGDKRGFVSENGLTRISANDAYTYITSHGYSEGDNILLVSCYGGVNGAGVELLNMIAANTPNDEYIEMWMGNDILETGTYANNHWSNFLSIKGHDGEFRPVKMSDDWQKTKVQGLKELKKMCDPRLTNINAH